MALPLMIALLFVIRTKVDSASNKTHCDTIRNNSICIQTSCLQSPCTLQCGLKTSQYDTCIQLCHSGKCNAFECRASQRCLQHYVLNSFGSMSCYAKDCTQSCGLKNCNVMTCPKTVNSCVQTSGREMTCEANICRQSCPKGGCRMACPIGGNNCTQAAVKGGAAMKCDRDVCEQLCTLGECSSMGCSSSVKTGKCQQLCTESKCESMTCGATKCNQTCSHGHCNMACSLGVKTCTQTGQLGNVTLQCDGDVCKQICKSGDCSMICSASVKECYQFCASGNCLYKCDAEICELTSLGGSYAAVMSDAPFKIGFEVYPALMPTLMFALFVNMYTADFLLI